ncbi:uncharacterized protein LOC141629107 [Silene latifolia]|uniref:uncharacterized protein LOC141629107 n=1 Tax=Silene latifolia TaxID=37657 RepID=UPI003D789B69
MVYAFNEDNAREDLWYNHRRLPTLIQGPWVVGGDFNCMSKTYERLGGTVTSSEAEPFQQCIEDCNLSDMQAIGAFYTWNSEQPPETRIYSRLDRMFINHEWFIHFSEYYANYLSEGHFDHTPFLVSKANPSQNKNTPFKYYNMWSKAPEFHDCVAKCWSQAINGTKMYGVVKKLKLLKSLLKKINRIHFSGVENRDDLAHTELIYLQKQLILKLGDMELMRQEHEAHSKFLLLHQAKMEFLK